MEVENILNEARNSISSYCINECKAYCCRKGYIVITASQAGIITKTTNSDRLIQINDEQYSLNLSPSCPALDLDNKCLIHKNINRPSVCHEFPFFIDGKNIHISNRCFANRENKFYSFILKLTKLGYTFN